MREIVFIPALLLSAPLAIWFLLWLYLKAEQKCKKRDKDSEKTKHSLASSMLYFLGSMATLSFCTVIGYFIQYFDVKMEVQAMMPVLTFAYCIIVTIQLILSKQMFPNADIMPVQVVPSDVDMSNEKEKAT
jgi:hypothetical protein